MTEHQKDTAFLRRAIRFGGTEECRMLEEQIIQVQLDARCVMRATLLMVSFVALTAAGFVYGLVFGDNFPYGQQRTIARVLNVVGLTSLISVGAFSVLLLFYRVKLDRLREDCRRLVTKLLECHPQGAGGRNLDQDTAASIPERDESSQCARTPTAPAPN